MMRLGKLFLVLAACLAGLGCQPQAPKPTGQHLVIAATAIPHAEILEHIAPILAREGVILDIKVFNDYVQPNVQVEQKQIDVNYFQTLPYLEQFNKDRGSSLIPIIGVHIEPLGVYSRKHASLDSIPEGAQIAIPNERSNEGRALLLLQSAGFIKLRDPRNALADLSDIVDNPRRLRFKELEAATLPRVLDQVDLAVINTNYALDAKLDPARDALFIESKDSPYVNYLVGRADNRDDPRVVKLAAALTSADTAAFITRTYQGAVVPAF